LKTIYKKIYLGWGYLILIHLLFVCIRHNSNIAEAFNYWFDIFYIPPHTLFSNYTIPILYYIIQTLIAFFISFPFLMLNGFAPMYAFWNLLVIIFHFFAFLLDKKNREKIWEDTNN
jgi:hypothetical protein